MVCKKNYKKIAFFDGCIVFFINLLVLFLSRIFPSPRMFNSHMILLKKFLENHKFVGNLDGVVAFFVPSALCLFYFLVWRKKCIESKLINLPIVYSCIGISGWIISFIIEVFILFGIKQYEPINIGVILLSTSFFSALSGLFSFTLCYFILETLNRKIILPRIFPEGHLWKYKGVIKPSIKLVNAIYFVSSVIFPTIYLLSVILAMYRGALAGKQPGSLLILYLAIFILVILIFFIFSSYYEVPIRKLIRGTEKIKNGDYNTSIKFVSNDDFGQLTDIFNDMISSINAKNDRVQAIQNSIIEGMAAMVESRDNSTGGHINRTSACVKVFVNHLQKENVYPQVTAEFYDNVIKAAPMHDLGKIAVDDAVLRKPGKFTDEEYEKMKAHSAEGARIVRSVLKESDDEAFKQIAENVAHFHHEKWNGQGYPTKIKEEQIPFEARIMALADVFDALVSKRCYKDSFSFDKAFQIIEESLGSHFDPKLGSHFLHCRPELEQLYVMLLQD